MKPSGTVQFFNDGVPIDGHRGRQRNRHRSRPPPLTLGSHRSRPSIPGTATSTPAPRLAVAHTVGHRPRPSDRRPRRVRVRPGQHFTVNVTANDPAASPHGTVDFLQRHDLLGTATIGTNGIATLTTTALPVGVNSAITAQYLGDNTFGSSTSANSSVTVTKRKRASQ